MTNNKPNYLLMVMAREGYLYYKSHHPEMADWNEIDPATRMLWVQMMQFAIAAFTEAAVEDIH